MHIFFLATTLPLAAASSVLMPRDCKAFIPGGVTGKGGYLKQGSKIRTSEFLDCGSRGSGCIPDKEPKGLIVHPTLNITARGGKDAARDVFKLLKDGEGGVDFKMVDVNETIVIKYVNPPGRSLSGWPHQRIAPIRWLLDLRAHSTLCRGHADVMWRRR
ncbi:hypothetical protein PG987_003256 [Apiospora arundinis]